MQNERRFYVYTLTDPRNGEVFYVGKGSGHRDKVHVRDARRWCKTNPAKTRRIREIEDAGHSVVVQRIATGLSEPQAFRRERQEIAKIGLANLTNATPGQNTEAERLILQIDEQLELLYNRVISVFCGVPIERERWHMTFHFIRSLRKMRADAMAELAD